MWVFDEWGKIENPRKGHNQNVVLICQSGALAIVVFQININFKGKMQLNLDLNNLWVLSAIVASMNAFI